MTKLTLTKHDFSDLFHADGLMQLDKDFLDFLQEKSALHHASLMAYREQKPLSPIETSELLINCAAILEEFIIRLFQIEEAVTQARLLAMNYHPIALFKKYFVLKRAKKEMHQHANLPSFSELNHWLSNELQQAALKVPNDLELSIALLARQYLEKPDIYADKINQLVAWCIQALLSDEGKAITKNFQSFVLPQRTDYENLVPTVSAPLNFSAQMTAPENLRERDGFKLTDARMNAREVQNEIHYCIYCHDHDGDFCSKGFPEKKGNPALGFKKNALDLTLTGCPLEEKISEAHFLKKDGANIAALAMIMIDNPMCPATGHRICNDCMKACIYQKQDPVNIPQIETRILTDVLDLPFGVEIYDLFTRWNPLRPQQWCMKPYNGMKILIAGMGPAGFTLAHHLLLEGFAVVGFDGLKIEPLAPALIQKPIYSFSELKESLDERLMAGFGGVAEYGITVRWDKNFLKLIYLSLLRKPYFQVFGSVRFGGTLTVEDAWKLGFDHLAIAVGAGLPKALSIPGSLAPGMRPANDFLMALQLGNAAKKNSLTNLQIRLPAVIIGGGLTGVDTATEIQAYYITQVEKIYERYQILIVQYGEEKIRAAFDPVSGEILDEYLRHACAIQAERALAKTENRQPQFIKLIHQWGGVTIAYRRNMQTSPAYLNNHEELKKALEEGIFYAQGLEPVKVLLDQHGHASGLLCQKRKVLDGVWTTTDEMITLPAKSILTATGTQPNTAYEFEHKGTFNRINLQYQHYEEINGELTIAHGVAHCKDKNFGPYTSYALSDKRVSLVGDTHPVFHGNVVKAIASGLRAYPKITALLQQKNIGRPICNKEYANFRNKMQHLFAMRVHAVSRINHNTVELKIHAPLAALHFQPGQFYRLQNYESSALKTKNTVLQMEPLAIVAAEVENDILTFLIKEKTTAAKLCAVLKKDEPVSLMGPTGVRAKIPKANETILIIGDQSSFAFVRSYGKELKQAGNRVIFLVFLNDPEELYQTAALFNATDVIIFATPAEKLFHLERAQDIALSTCDLAQALQHYAQNASAPAPLLADVDRVYVVGETSLLKSVQGLRRKLFNDICLKNPKFYGSVYGNMQCMLKGVCAQCLQWQIDPETGARTKAVFACSWQDQPLEIIDMQHLDERQHQNQMHEKLNNLWLDHVLLNDHQ